MGLFDRFKKQKNEVEEATVTEEMHKDAEEVVAAKKEAQEATEEIKTAKKEAQEVVREAATEAEKSANAKEIRRFTFLVEDLSALPEEQGVVVGGFLYGAVQKGDEVYVIQPAGNIITTKVYGIEVGPNQTADSAQNQKITMLLRDIKNEAQVPKYTVLTSIKPQTTINAKVAVENPQLLGMSMDYPRLCKDNTYINLLVYVLCHAHYIVPARVDKEPENNGDGTATIKQESKMRFPSLLDPADKTKNVFPVFTDWLAMANWKNLFDETHPPKSVIMRFPEVMAVCKRSSVVINAFGPTPVFLPEKMIEQIVGMEAYQQEFGANAENTVKKMQVEQEAKVYVGVPKENEEIKLIKEAMVAQAQTEEQIRRVDFLLKMDVQKERAYLCVVDCPEEQAKQLFTGMHKAVAPYLNDVKRLEFLLYGKSKLANDVISEKSCIYQA